MSVGIGGDSLLMRILVAGGFGQVGRALADQSLKTKVDLIALDRTELDIACTPSITSAFDKFKPDILINAADLYIC